MNVSGKCRIGSLVSLVNLSYTEGGEKGVGSTDFIKESLLLLGITLKFQQRFKSSLQALFGFC
jgi:hypothetical protein